MSGDIVLNGVRFQRDDEEGWVVHLAGDRGLVAPVVMMNAALDEIDRLRAENQSWRSLDTMRLNEVQRLRAEVDALTAEVDAWKQDADRAWTRGTDLLAENYRLRGGVDFDSFLNVDACPDGALYDANGERVWSGGGVLFVRRQEDDDAV